MEGISTTAALYSGLFIRLGLDNFFLGYQNPHDGHQHNGCALFRAWKFLYNDFTNKFSEYLEHYVHTEEDIDDADVDKYEKIEPGFMDYDVSNVFRDV